MCYYSKTDASIDAKLRHLNQLVHEGWMKPHEAAAIARTFDPAVYTCPKCGALQASCLCTIEIDPAVIEEMINRDNSIQGC